MAEVTDQIIAELIARDNGYTAVLDKAIAKHKELMSTAMTVAEGQKQYADLHSRSANDTAKAEEQATQVITRAKKTQSDAAKQASAAEKQAAKEAAAAAKAAAKERADAAKAIAKAEADAAKEVQRRAAETAAAEQRLAVAAQNATRIQIEELERLKAAEREATNQAKANAFLTGGGSGKSARGSAAVFREQLPAYEAARQVAATPELHPINIVEPGSTRGSGANLGATVGGRADAAAATEIMRQTRVEAEKEVVAEKEVNAALVEQTKLRAALLYTDGEDRRSIQEQLADRRAYDQLLKDGLSEQAAAIELATIQDQREAYRTEQVAKRLLLEKTSTGGRGDANTFAREVTGGRLRGIGPGAIAGAAVAVGAGIAIEAVKTATDYADALNKVSHQAGITAEALQIYHHAAEQTGGSADDVDKALSHLTDQLGKAQTGSKDAAKAFTALGVPLQKGDTAGSLLPTLIDRLSTVKDEAQRSTIEVALFGESGKNLDQLLSGGNQKVNELAEGLIATGKVLSSADIAKLEDTSKKLADVKAQLTVDMAQIVANNAEAIKGLANAFVHLADDIKGALHWLDQFDQASPFLAKLDQNPVAAGASLSPGGKGLAPWFYDTIKQSGKYLGFADDGTTPARNKLTPGGLDSLADSAHNYLAKVRPGKINQSAIDTFNQGRGRKGPNPNTALNEADERTKRFNDAMARYQDEILAATAQQTSDEEKRRDIEREQLRRDEARQIDDLKTQADIDKRKAPKDAGLINDRLQQQIKAVQDVTAERLDKINLDSTLSSLSRQNDADNAILEFKNQQLQAQESLAKTAADRRDLELQILANEQQIAKNNANLVLSRKTEGDPTITKADVNAAQRTLDNLPADTASKTAVIDRQTQGPWADYVDKLPTTAKQIDEAFQQAAVSGVERLNDSLDQSISKMLHLHGVAGEFLNDLIKIGLHALEGQLFGGASAGSSGGLGGLGGLLGGFGKLLGLGGGGGGSGLGLSAFASDPLTGLSSDLLGWADGGSGVIGGNPGVDQNVLSLNGTPIRKVGRGELLSVQPHNAVNPNMRVNSPQVSGPVINQTIRYAGAVDIADRNYVNQVAAAQFEATRQAIGQGMGQAVQASPRQVAYDQKRGSSS